MGKFCLAVLCGGPSGERGISLNSARSVCDHLDAAGADDEVEIRYLYMRDLDEAYPIERAQLYSNTPLDFDFALAASSPLDGEAQRAWLAGVDLVVPVIHGRTGEDGQIQRRLAAWGLPFWGSDAAACARAYPKHGADGVLAPDGTPFDGGLPWALVRRDQANDASRLRTWVESERTRAGETLVVKPRHGGSSLGVTMVRGADEALAAASELFTQGHDEVVVEPKLSGSEFTVLVLEGRDGHPVALLPTEVELRETGLFSYQRKYLASEAVALHTPARFDDPTVARIQRRAEEMFAALSLRHFARLDGWRLPSGEVIFTDVNPISGMEQNSFLFQQTSRIGLSHRDTLRYLIERACASYGLTPPRLSEVEATAGKRPVAVLGGGVTAEREVSLLSATNVWMKLRTSSRYAPSFFLMASEDEIWSVPYGLCLGHTVAEVASSCRNWPTLGPRLSALAAPLRRRLGLGEGDLHAAMTPPERTTRAAFVASHELVFLGLHGGIGEDGRMQAELGRAGVRHNGSGAAASALCMDKAATGEAIRRLGVDGLGSLAKVVVPLAELEEARGASALASPPSPPAPLQLRGEGSVSEALQARWQALVDAVGGPSLIVKPVGDGCSAGVCRLDHAGHLGHYLSLLAAGAPVLPAGALRAGEGAIRLPEGLTSLLFERCLEVDRVRVDGGALRCEERDGWVEVTVGVLGEQGSMRALSPSITVAEGVVLSLEEKFQGGTGVNLTPPPASLVAPAVLGRVRSLIEAAAAGLGLAGYARIDAFVHRATGDVIIIEANTLPGLSPSTVLFHQGLAERPPMPPRQLLERVLELGEAGRGGR